MKIRDRLKDNYETPSGMGVFIWWCKVHGISDPRKLSDDELDRTWAMFQVEMSDAEREALEKERTRTTDDGVNFTVNFGSKTLVPELWSKEMIETCAKNIALQMDAEILKDLECKYTPTLQKKKPGV